VAANPAIMLQPLWGEEIAMNNRETHRVETKYAQTERAKYWPVSAELMAEYKNGTQTYETMHGTLHWEKNDLLHRDGDQPAVIDVVGNLYWYQNNLLHRDEDRPARIDENSLLLWYQNNKWHRSSGPAVIYPSGTLEWWINGEDITLEVRKWLARTKWQGTPEQITEFKLRFA
jgi:hypothetical protein